MVSGKIEHLTVYVLDIYLGGKFTPKLQKILKFVL